MNNLQFTLEYSPLLSIQSPGIVDISSDSGEEFVVHPNDLSVVEERFRVGGPRYVDGIRGRNHGNPFHIWTRRPLNC